MLGTIGPFQCSAMPHSSEVQLTWQSNRTRNRDYRRTAKPVKNINGVGFAITVSVVRVRALPAAGASSPYRTLSTGSESKEPFSEKETYGVEEYWISIKACEKSAEMSHRLKA